MRGVTSGLAGGSSLALAWKALQVLDRPTAIAEPHLLCENFCQKAALLDWFSFSVGLVFGIAVFAFVELVVTVRWVLVASLRQTVESGPGELPRSNKPLYKLL